MSESHELYKKYLAAKRKTEYAERIESKYVSDYVKDEQIARAEWKVKERDEKDDDDKVNRLFGNNY